MVMKVLMLLLTLGMSSAVDTKQQSNAAVQKVIQMLQDMSATSKREKQDEEIAFAKFKTWCSEESAELKRNIVKNTEEIELLTADIGKGSSDATTLGEEIAKLQEDVSKWEANKKEATAQRDKDHVDFVAEQQDYAESVSALDRAIQVMQKQDYDRTGEGGTFATQGDALLQVSADSRIPSKVKSIVAAFLSMMDSPDGNQNAGYDAPEANAYEFQSGGIVQLLQKLQIQFSKKLGDCQKEELNSKHAFDMVMQDLTDSVEYATKDTEQKSMEKERKLTKVAQDKKQLGATIDVKAANEKTLTEMTTECEQKRLSFVEKQQLRADEIEAIAKAVEILSSEAVTGNAEKHLDLAQAQSGATSLAVSSFRSGGVRRDVRDFLAAAATRLGSKGLELLSEKIAADPFAKVKHLIDSMITRLLEEANADADHEGYCTKEMGESKITRNKLNEEIDNLAAAVESGKSTIMTLTQDIAELAEEVAELDTSVAEATGLRVEEKKVNKATVEDAKAGQAAVDAATKVLKDFYEKAAGATGFLQLSAQKAPYNAPGMIKMGSDEWDQLANPNFEGTVDKGHKEGMQTFGTDKEHSGGTQGKTYVGMQSQAGGVLALLEVIQSDFANLQADTEANEAASEKAYDDFMVESKKNKAVKERKMEMNSSDKAAAESRLRDDIADLKSTQDQLLAADRYHEKLVPQCIDKGMTWDERQAARQSEITSLKEALVILSRDNVETSAGSSGQ